MFIYNYKSSKVQVVNLVTKELDNTYCVNYYLFQVPGSSNGRTCGSGPQGWGSSPCPGAIFIAIVYIFGRKHILAIFLTFAYSGLKYFIA